MVPFECLPCYLSRSSFVPVGFLCWVQRRGFARYFGVSGDWRSVVADEVCVAILQRPVAVLGEVPSPYPFTGFVWVAALGPVPQHLVDPVAGVCERCLRRAVSVIIRPAPYFRAEFFDHLSRWRLFVPIQIVFECSKVSEYFVLFRAGQEGSAQLSDLEAQEVKPFLYNNTAGFSFVESQSFVSQKPCDFGECVCFENLSCWGCNDEIVGIPNNTYALILSFAQGGRKEVSHPRVPLQRLVPVHRGRYWPAGGR